MPRELTLRQCKEDVKILAELIYDQYPSERVIKLWGIPRGGISVALLLVAHNPMRFCITDDPMQADIAVDDILDSGSTSLKVYINYNHLTTYALYGRFPNYPHGKSAVQSPEWLSFPWERSLKGEDQSGHDIVTRMLQKIGEDPSREGLLETPRRVVAAWDEWFKGYKEDPTKHLKTFEDGAEDYDEMVLVSPVPVMSHCEHHIAPFTGQAHVAYIPNKKIIGLSKIPKIVDTFSRRLQVQERLTSQIAKFLWEGLDPKGVAVVIKAQHSCMCHRGVKATDSGTITLKLYGAFKDNPETRAEFMSCITNHL